MFVVINVVNKYWFFSVACLRKELGLADKRIKRLLQRLGNARLDSRMKKKVSYPLRNRL